MLDEQTKIRLRSAFESGSLEVRSSDSLGSVDWFRVTDVLQHSTPHKRAFKVACSEGSVICTEDHSLFVFESGVLREIETSALVVGNLLAVVEESQIVGCPVLAVEEVEPLSISYDISVPGPENFALSNGILAHNTYSIGGISLDIEKSSKYGDLKQSASDQFDKMLERMKATIKIVKGLQQPKYGAGIRSSFGPYTGKGVLSPAKFVGL